MRINLNQSAQEAGINLHQELLSMLEQQAAEAEQLGTLPRKTVELLKASRVMRMLQPRQFGGLEMHPNHFLQAVMTIAAKNPSAGWVAGVVGVHNWEAALNDERLLQELWGLDADTWIASPYSPMGSATPVEGGYLLNGRWTFSSGTDHCAWLVLGAAVPAGEQPRKVLHVMLPRQDYEIVADSWKVVGLQGTGSKDVTVKDAFIPAYRCLETRALMNGECAAASQREGALYRMPWSSIFPNAITAALLGICQGALEAAQQHVKVRIVHANAAPEPFMMAMLGEAASEIAASQAMMLKNVGDAYALADNGFDVALARRASNRSEQVRGAWRAVRAVNDVFNRCGGAALNTNAPLQRFWKDANCALNHATFTGSSVYQVNAAMALGIATDEQIQQAMI